MRTLTVIVLSLSCHFAFTQPLMFQSDAAHKGVVAGNKNTLLGTAAWSFKTGGKVFSSPVAEGNAVYFGSEDGFVYALDAKSGDLLWKFRTGGAVHATPALYAEYLYVGSFDGFYYCLDRKTGREIWKFKTGGERWQGGRGYFGMKPDTMQMDDPWDYFLSSPVIVANKKETTVFFGSSDGYVYALNGKTGVLKWKFKTEGIIHGSPAISNGVLYIGSWDTYLYALDTTSGKLLWKFKTGDQPAMSGIQPSPTVANGNVYFGARDPFFYALDAKTGALKWKYNAENSWILSTAAFDKNTLYVGTSDTYLVLALDAATGKEKWRRKLNGYVYGSPCLTGKALFIGDFTGRLYSLDLTTGAILSTFETESFKANQNLLKADGTMSFQDIAADRDLASYPITIDVMNTLFKLGPIVSSAAILGDRIFVGSSNGSLYAIELTSVPSVPKF